MSTVKGPLKYYTLRTDLAGNFVDASWVHIPVVCIKNSYHWLLDGEELTEPNLLILFWLQYCPSHHSTEMPLA